MSTIFCPRLKVFLLTSPQVKYDTLNIPKKIKKTMVLGYIKKSHL